jgi:hypothetical protein
MICKRCKEYINAGKTQICLNCGCKTNNKVKTLEEEFPDITKEWDYSKNELSPSLISSRSGKKVSWIGKCGHRWETSISNRTTKNSNCPICANRTTMPGYNDIRTTHPNLLIEWDYSKNIIKPTEVSFGSDKIKIWWKCCKCSNSWLATSNQRTNLKSNCPYCSNQAIIYGYNDLLTTHPDIAKELADIDLAKRISHGYDKKVLFKCKKCNYQWKTFIYSRLRGTGCPKCNFSTLEIKTKKILDNLGISNETQKRFNICKDKRELPFDFYIPQYNVCIECHGIQHYPYRYKKSSFSKTSRGKKLNLSIIKHHDKIKYHFCKNNDIKLIRIPYWKYNNIQDILIKKLNLYENTLSS